MVERGWRSITKQSEGKTSDSGHWMDQAKCKDWDFKKNGDPFFPASSGLAAAKEALTVCAACPVQLDCQFYAAEKSTTQGSGIFGGTLPEERIRGARREQRSRSRKSRAKVHEQEEQP